MIGWLNHVNHVQIEGQRADMAKAEAERSAMSKLDKIKSDQTARAAALAREAEEAELRASLIQYNLEAVDAVITALNESLASGNVLRCTILYAMYILYDTSCIRWSVAVYDTL